MRLKLEKYTIVFLLSLFCVIFLFPIYWLLNTSLKGFDEFYSLPPHFFPFHITFYNYFKAFTIRPLAHQFLNSVIVSVTSVVVAMFLAAMAGYGFSRYKFKAKGFWLYSILIVKMFPAMSLLVPFYTMYLKLSMTNTLFALVITYTAIHLPLVIWLSMGFYDEIPSELYEASVLEGCNEFQLFWRVALPLAKPGVIATGILAFIWAWNEFPIALVLTDTQNVQTLPISIASFLSNETKLPMGAMSAAGIVSIIPSLLLAFFAQKYIMSGFVTGAVKG